MRGRTHQQKADTTARRNLLCGALVIIGPCPNAEYRMVFRPLDFHVGLWYNEVIKQEFRGEVRKLSRSNVI